MTVKMVVKKMQTQMKSTMLGKLMFYLHISFMKWVKPACSSMVCCDERNNLFVTLPSHNILRAELDVLISVLHSY